MTNSSGRFLLVDTADRIAMIGIYDGETTLAEERSRQGRPGLGWMTAVVARLAARCGIRFDGLEFLACGIGPGGFTSLRMGLSFVKAMGQALNLPVVGVNRLEAAAVGQAIFSNEIRGEFWVRLPAAQNLDYVAAYRLDSSGPPVCVRPPSAMTPARISRLRIPKTAVHVTANPELFYLGIPRMAHLKARAGMFEPAGNILPLYLRGATLGPRGAAIAKKRRVR